VRWSLPLLASCWRRPGRAAAVARPRPLRKTSTVGESATRRRRCCGWSRLVNAAAGFSLRCSRVDRRGSTGGSTLLRSGETRVAGEVSATAATKAAGDAPDGTYLDHPGATSQVTGAFRAGEAVTVLGPPLPCREGRRPGRSSGSACEGRYAVRVHRPGHVTTRGRVRSAAIPAARYAPTLQSCAVVHAGDPARGQTERRGVGVDIVAGGAART